MNAVADKVPPYQAPQLAPATQEETLMAVISRAASDPAFDINKMERLMQMHQQLGSQKSLAAFNTAMSAAQAEMGPISADAQNPQTKSAYASYAKLDRVLRPIYTKHGFALSFGEGVTDKPNYIRITCRVSHNAGHTEVYHKDMPADGKGAKGGDVMTLTHASGAAQTYGMRYILKGIFNVAIGENDNDGNDEGDYVGPGQAANIRSLLTEVNANEESFLRTIKAESIEKIKADAYSTVIGILEAKRRHVR